MASWKIQPSGTERQIQHTPFLQCRKYFAVDDSGSTAGAVLRKERAFVESFRESYPNTADAMSLWGTRCDNPTTQFQSVEWNSTHMGTNPSEILRNETALTTIRKADVWFLLTDGEIYEGDVHRLADLAYDAQILNVPLVFVITGSRGSSPGTANISVGISFFASSHDTLIIFKDVQTGKLYVIAGKGCFAELGGSAAAQDLTSWTDLTAFTNEAEFFSHCDKTHVKVTEAESRTSSTGHISLGSEWETQHNGPVKVDLDALLGSGLLPDTDAFNLLSEEAFNYLAVACKTRRRIHSLRTFVQGQKIEQVAPKFEDRNGAAKIIAMMTDTTTTEDDRQKLQQQLREAHSLNRRDYQETIASFAGSPAEQNLKKRNQLVDAALRSLASVEAAGYNADIIGRGSNRARRAQAIDSTSTIDVAELDLDAPSYKGYCLICCGEEEIMSVCFKEPDHPESKEDNTNDFALNFPLAAGASYKNIDLISSQNVCFQCALLGPDGMSIYKEPLTAIIPAVQYTGSNKKYINNQLYSALTARLATGAAGVAQLFMSILMGVMRTKAWAGAATDAQSLANEEASQRRDLFQWMLNQVVQNTLTRETFNEKGDWVKFPQALSWIAGDFQSNGLASFAVTYPMAGFDSLIALGQHTGEFSDSTISRLKSVKLLYTIAATYITDLKFALQREFTPWVRQCTREAWKQSYLELIYLNFNGPLVPLDKGDSSILDDVDTFQQRLSALLRTFEPPMCNTAAIRKIQILLFWLLFTQHGHCTAQTFFTRISQDEHLAPAILDPDLTVPTSEHRNILLSIFAQHNATLINPTIADSHKTLIPFANPFGASVLHCGAPSCSQPFCDPKTLDPQTLTDQTVWAIRDARTKHLVDVFGIQGRFERSDTGLPERAAMGQPPTSLHSNMHITIVREWVGRDADARRGIVQGGDARAEFAEAVCERLCQEGRGDIHNAHLKQDIIAMLPSFFDVLAVALRAEGKSDEDVAVYEHNMESNKLHSKITWELTSGQS